MGKQVSVNAMWLGQDMGKSLTFQLTMSEAAMDEIDRYAFPTNVHQHTAVRTPICEVPRGQSHKRMTGDA